MLPPIKTARNKKLLSPGLHWLHRLSVAVLHVTASKPGPLLWILKTLASVQEGIICSAGKYFIETFPSVGEKFRELGHLVLLVSFTLLNNIHSVLQHILKVTFYEHVYKVPISIYVVQPSLTDQVNNKIFNAIVTCIIINAILLS